MLKAALLGAGGWGQKLLTAVRDSTNIKITTVLTRDPAGRSELARKFGVTLTADYNEILAHPGIDAVVIATPHSQHAGQIALAAKAKKHVFVEKPLTLTKASAERAIDACRAAGVTLAVGFNRRCAPAQIAMKQRIVAGEIGRLRFLEGHFSGPANYQIVANNWRSNNVESPGGAMTARGVHMLDSMIEMAGLITEVSAMSDRKQITIDIDDTTAALLKFAGGASGALTTLHASTMLWRLHVFGEKGSLEMRGDNELTAFDLDGKPASHSFAAVDKERAVLEKFAADVGGGVKFPIAPEALLNNVVVTEAIAGPAKSKPVKLV